MTTCIATTTQIDTSYVPQGTNMYLHQKCGCMGPHNCAPKWHLFGSSILQGSTIMTNVNICRNSPLWSLCDCVAVPSTNPMTLFIKNHNCLGLTSSKLFQFQHTRTFFGKSKTISHHCFIYYRNNFMWCIFEFFGGKHFKHYQGHLSPLSNRKQFSPCPLPSP